MAYTPDYDTSDLTAASTDLLAIGVIQVAALASLIVLIILLVWGVKQVRKRF
jgi:hypothetical protein